MNLLKFEHNTESLLKELEKVKTDLSSGEEAKCPSWHWHTDFRPETNGATADCKLCAYMFPKLQEDKKGLCPEDEEVYGVKEFTTMLDELIKYNTK